MFKLSLSVDRQSLVTSLLLGMCCTIHIETVICFEANRPKSGWFATRRLGEIHTLLRFTNVMCSLLLRSLLITIFQSFTLRTSVRDFRKRRYTDTATKMILKDGWYWGKDLGRSCSDITWYTRAHDECEQLQAAGSSIQLLEMACSYDTNGHTAEAR